MQRSEFEKLVIKAIEALPARIREKIKNVAIVIEKWPRKKIGGKAFAKTSECLLGLYEGIPLTAWGRDFSGKLPDKITIFQEPIEQLAGSQKEVPRIVREIVWHEIGHYFGLDDKRLRVLEKKRESTK